jgi:hypothetical protein
MGGPMSDPEPRNAASDTLRVNFTQMSAREFLDGSPGRLDPDFVHEDRRNRIAPVRANAEHVVDTVHVYDAMSGGHPVFSVDEVVAVRGDRLLLARTRIEFPERAHSIVALQVFQYDETCARCQRSIMFDADALEAAMTALDELAATLET